MTTPTVPAAAPQRDGAGTGPRSAARARRLRRRRIVAVVGAVLLVVLVVGGFLVAKTAAISGRVFGGGGSVLGLAGSGAPLKTAPDGRVNVLVFGTSQDDASHAAAADGSGMWLTDSIQVLSIDPATKTAAMIAVPRDTWVKVPGSCKVGPEAKINAVYECASGLFDTPQAKVPDYASTDQRGAQALMTAVEQVLGLPMQYYAHVNYTVLRQSVDAVGGIDVSIVGDGHEGLFDTNMDGSCPKEAVSCRLAYYPRDGVYHLDGVHALALSRARGDANPRSCMQFGLDNGDFDRQANQQKVIAALKSRAVSAGTLANPSAVNQLLDALGDNVTTSFTTDEAKTAMELARNLGTMSPVSLTDPTDPVMKTGTVGKADVVEPVAGTYDYVKVHAWVAEKVAAVSAAASGAAPAPSTAATSSRGTTGSTGSTTSGSSGTHTTGTTGTTGTTASPTSKSTYEPPASCWGG